jgi:hypothetical protein
VAAATRLKPDLYGNLRVPHAYWTDEAWRQYEISGELRFACVWLGNALSRCRLVAMDVDDNGQILGPTTNKIAKDLVAGFMGGPTGTAEAMQAFGTHLTVPGDCYVTARLDGDGNLSDWEVFSTEELRPGNKPGWVTINRGDGLLEQWSLETTFVVRVHRPHPRRKWEADSATRSALPVLREIEQLSKHIFATIDSRLAGAGILMLPSEMDFPSPEGEVNPGESAVLALLAEAMMASIKDRGDARAVVPIVAQGPAAVLASAQWLVSPAMELTNDVADLRDRAIKRLALDLDVPPEVLLGVAAANDWNGWLIEESAVKLHVEPVMGFIAGALTKGYLQPALDAAGEDASKFCIWYDPSELVLRPNRASDAKDLFDRGVISEETLRRETGFTEMDEPQGDEKAKLEIITLLKAAPQLGDAMAVPLFKVMHLDRYGITEEDVKPAPDPMGGTPPIDDPDATGVVDPDNGPPVSGEDENKGPENPTGGA